MSQSQPSFAVILLAAGRSSRFGDGGPKKPFSLLKHQPVWLYSARLFRARSDVQQIIVVVSNEDFPTFCSENGQHIAELNLEVVLGGNERPDSVENGLDRVAAETSFVAIHDAARPCVDLLLIDRVFQKGIESGAAIPAIPVHSTVKRTLDGSTVEQTIDRSQLLLAQTPQVFRRDLIRELYSRRNGQSITDDAELAERLGVSVSLVEGSEFNLKITTPSDLAIAESLLDHLPGVAFDAPAKPFAASTRWK